MKTSLKAHALTHHPLSFLRTLLFGATLVAAPLAMPARAQITTPENGFGIGFMLGTPTGLSASLPIGGTNAFNATLGYDLGGGPNLYMQAAYVWIAKDIIPVDVGSVSAYYGPGAFVFASRDAALGIQVIGGIDYRFATAPVQVFLEIGPGINLLPDTRPHASGGLGIRYYF